MGDASNRRAELYGLLGDLPARDREVKEIASRAEPREGYDCWRLALDLNGIEDVPAYFLKPKGATGRLPVVLFNHSHGGNYVIGKNELVEGREYMVEPPYGQELTRAGYAVLAIDHWVFGERRGRTESAVFKEMLWNGRVMWGAMVYDSLKAVDYLLTRDDIDSARIATLGMSMGSTMAWWLAALDERIKVCVDICCLTDFQALLEEGHLDAHGVYYYVPSLLKHFSTAQINELIVPRQHLAVAGRQDVLTPAKGLDRIDAALKKAYADANAPEAWRLTRYDVPHHETPAMRREIMEWLKRWL